MDLHDHLLAAQQWVADEFARAQGHLVAGHDCGCSVVDDVESWKVSARLGRQVREKRQPAFGYAIFEVGGCAGSPAPRFSFTTPITVWDRATERTTADD